MNNELIDGGWFELPTMIQMYCDLCNMLYNQSGGESWDNVAYLASSLATLEVGINRLLDDGKHHDYPNITDVSQIPEVIEIHTLWD